MFTLLKNIFGNSFLQNTAIIFTNWEKEELAEQEEQTTEWNTTLKARGILDGSNEIKCFYIDN